MIWFGRGLTVLIGAFFGYMTGGMLGGLWMLYGSLVCYFLLPHARGPIIGALGNLPYIGMMAGTLAGIVIGAKVSRHFEWRGHRGA